MTDKSADRAKEFHRLHGPGKLLLLPNAWDAGSARLIEASGATAIATTSAGLAWSRGYPDGGHLPPRVVAAAIAEIARVLSVPLSADIETGYSAEPREVGEVVAAVVEAGVVGINIEDGASSVHLMCAKIAAAKASAARAGIDLFVNARTDVYLRGLVPRERAAAETIDRARRYRAAGCDGLFVPGVADAGDIRQIASAIELPLNVMVLPGLPPVADLRTLGVRRVSAGDSIASAAYATARRAAARFLSQGVYDAMFEATVAYDEMNALFSEPK